MSFKRFRQKDIVHSTIVAKPEFNFIIHSGNVYLQRERSTSGDFSNNIKHVASGHVSLKEVNINRPADSLVYSFIEKDSTRYSFKTVSVSDFDDSSLFSYGNIITQSYPLSASVNRIYVPSGPEFTTGAGTASEVAAHANKKYIRAIKNPLNFSDQLNSSNRYGGLGTKSANLICIPGIFAGSKIDKGSIELNYYITGTLIATAKDSNSDGRIMQTYGTEIPIEVGLVLYNQGLIILTGSSNLHHSQDYFFSEGSATNPSWLSFGTGIVQTGTQLSHGSVEDSSYSIDFKGTNKTPTITMFAFSEKGEHNFSHNPTFLSKSLSETYDQNEDSYTERNRPVKKINKTPYADHEADFESTTYISKVGIYDDKKNLIAIASLATPVKKTENRDYMFKLRLDV